MHKHVRTRERAHAHTHTHTHTHTPSTHLHDPHSGGWGGAIGKAAQANSLKGAAHWAEK